MGSSRIDGGNGNESFGFGEASLSQVQDRQETGCDSGDLPESSAQAATRLGPSLSNRCPASRSLVMELAFFASVHLGWDMQRSGGGLLLGTSLLGGRNGTYCWN
jgi:hypothetical protein